MKKNNFSHLPAQVVKTVLRFPVTTLFCVALFIVNILAIEYVCWDAEWDACEDVYYKCYLLLPLGIVLSMAVRVFTEDIGLRGWRSAADVLVVPLLAVYYVLLPVRPHDFLYTSDVYYYVVFCLTALIGLCCAPYRRIAQPRQFWQYNIKIWGRVLFSAFYATIFFAGINLALLAIGALFEVHIQEKWYQYNALFFYVLFASLFFAAGLPVPAQMTGETDKNYPVPRVLGQYILLPILLIYFLILMAYGGRILLLWQLPKGLVSGLALAYSAAGLLIYFLLHHLYVARDTRIATLFGRWFFYSELPVVALLGIAIFRRTSDYGMTESRYYLWLAVAWLLGLSLYMIFTKGKSFRPVLLSLAAAALLSVVGPWSAFNVSESSQMRRLQQLMTKNDLLQDGKYVCDSLKPVSQADYDEMEDIIRYFAKKERAHRLQPLFTPDLDTLLLTRGYIAQELFCDNLSVVEETVTPDAFTVEVDGGDGTHLAITGYDQLVRYNYYDWREDDDGLSADDSTFACKIKERPGGVLELYRYGTHYKSLSLPGIVRQITAVDWEQVQYETFPVDSLSIVIDSQCKIIFTEIQGTRNYQRPFSIGYAEMYILEKK
jgi:hypothetical protein